MTSVVAVDLGAGSGRLILGTRAHGALELREVSRFTTPSRQAASGRYQCWDIDAVEGHIREGLSRCVRQAQIASVGVDSWGVDYVLLDAEMRRVGEPVCYRDARTQGMIEQVQRRMPAEDIYRRTGIQFQSFNTLYQVAACARQERSWIDAAAHLALIPDYLHQRLSGVLANEYTNATTTQMLGIDGEWDGAILSAAGLTHSLMGTPVQAGTELGKIELDGKSINVIAPATHDTASAVAGAPLETADEAYISSGTWSLMGVESRMPYVTPEAMRMNFTNEGGVERRFRVLKNIMGMWPLQRICEELHVDDVGALVEEAKGVAGWNSVANLDDGVFLNPPHMAETLQAYCRKTGQPIPSSRAELARCIFDSLALTYRNVKEQLETLRQRKLTRIRIIGGGSRNALLNQLCADACQLPVSAGPVEASALGNLCTQMIALGELENLEAARELIRASFPPLAFRPQAEPPAWVWERFQELLKFRFQKGVE